MCDCCIPGRKKAGTNTEENKAKKKAEVKGK